jgi:hypothetical protein
MTIQDRMNDVGFEFDTEWATYTQATEHAIANFTGDDEIDPDVVELVADLGRQAIQLADEGKYAQALMLVEKASTFVQVDLDELEMTDWIGELDTQLEEYGLGSFQ